MTSLLHEIKWAVILTGLCLAILWLAAAYTDSCEQFRPLIGM